MSLLGPGSLAASGFGACVWGIWHCKERAHIKNMSNDALVKEKRHARSCLLTKLPSESQRARRFVAGDPLRYASPLSISGLKGLKERGRAAKKKVLKGTVKKSPRCRLLGLAP